MATQVQNRRGTTAEHSTFAGANGELTVDTTKKTVVVHDGTTAGGAPLLRENGSQNAATTGTSTAASFIPTSSTVPTNGVYLPAANTVGLATNGTGRLFVDSSGRVGVGTTNCQSPLDVRGAIGAIGAASNNGIIIGDYGSGTAPSTGTFSITAASGKSLVFSDETAAVERARIDSSGRLLVRTSSARGNYRSSTVPTIQLEETADNGISIFVNANSVNGPYLWLGKSRGTTTGSNTIVQNNDSLGAVRFNGADGTNVILGAQISAEVDGTPGTNDMPGRLIFSTTADGASSPTERMRIRNDGRTLISASSAAGITGAGAAFTADNANPSTSGVATYASSLGAGGSANNTACAHFVGITQGVNYYYLYGNGTSSFTSDARKKKNIETTRDGYLEDLSRLRVVKYNWINQADGDPKELGLIAQEVEKIFPGLVQDGGQLEGDDFNCKVLKGSVLLFMLLKGLQESAERIEALEAKVAALEAA